MDARIIIIDDEVIFLESLRRGLSMYGFTDITLEPDALKAVQLIEGTDNYDVALIDITMPGLSGIELLDRFAQSSPGTACIMVSGLHDDQLIQQCLDRGACDYMIKPISRQDVIQSVSSALARRQSGRGTPASTGADG